MFLRSFQFLAKEHCVIFHFQKRTEKNGMSMFFWVSLVAKNSRKERKRTEHSFLRTEKNITYQTEKNGVPHPGFWRLMRPKRMQHSFAKNGKELKERNILLQRKEKKARTFRSFAKERENVPFFFQQIYINIYKKKNGTFFKKNGISTYLKCPNTSSIMQLA